MHPRCSRLYQYSLALTLLAIMLLPARAEATEVRLGDLLLWAGVTTWTPERPDTPVLFMDIPHRGVACAESFRDVPGNAQHLCPDGYEGILIHRDIGWGELPHVLFHEEQHLLRGPDGPPHDPFSEIEIDRLACAAFPVEECGR